MWRSFRKSKTSDSSIEIHEHSSGSYSEEKEQRHFEEFCLATTEKTVWGNSCLFTDLTWNKTGLNECWILEWEFTSLLTRWLWWGANLFRKLHIRLETQSCGLIKRWYDSITNTEQISNHLKVYTDRSRFAPREHCTIAILLSLWVGQLFIVCFLASEKNCIGQKDEWKIQIPDRLSTTLSFSLGDDMEWKCAELPSFRKHSVRKYHDHNYSCEADGAYKMIETTLIAAEGVAISL